MSKNFSKSLPLQKNESGNRKAKTLPTKALAEHYRRIRYAQLNSEVFTGTVTVDWPQMKDKYIHYKKVKGDEQSTLYETAPTMRHFERLIGRCNSKQNTQNTTDKFILDRGKEIKRSTLNKDIRNLAQSHGPGFRSPKSLL